MALLLPLHCLFLTLLDILIVIAGCTVLHSILILNVYLTLSFSDYVYSLASCLYRKTSVRTLVYYLSFFPCPYFMGTIFHKLCRTDCYTKDGTQPKQEEDYLIVIEPCEATLCGRLWNHWREKNTPPTAVPSL